MCSSLMLLSAFLAFSTAGRSWKDFFNNGNNLCLVAAHEAQLAWQFLKSQYLVEKMRTARNNGVSTWDYLRQLMFLEEAEGYVVCLFVFFNLNVSVIS